jgi:5,10-methenyltetrahydrofolate synthetase
LSSASPGAVSGPRSALRKSLLEQREGLVAGATGGDVDAALARHLKAVLSALEPSCLGLYWVHRAEFNAAAAITADPAFAKVPLALPFAQRAPVRLHYRAWDGRDPMTVDDCGIPASNGAPVLPDVVLVPCVGYTDAGHRLGYGGGYFDRWLAQHPHVTAIGVAWSGSEIDAGALDVQAHDRPLTLVLTERGVA